MRAESDDLKKQQNLLNALDEARKDLRLNGPVPAEVVQEMLDALHLEWDLEDAEEPQRAARPAE